MEGIRNREDPEGYIEQYWVIALTLHLGETLVSKIWPEGMPGSCGVGWEATLAIIPCHNPNRTNLSSIGYSVNVLWQVVQEA